MNYLKNLNVQTHKQYLCDSDTSFWHLILMKMWKWPKTIVDYFWWDWRWKVGQLEKQRSFFGTTMKNIYQGNLTNRSTKCYDYCWCLGERHFFSYYVFIVHIYAVYKICESRYWWIMKWKGKMYMLVKKKLVNCNVVTTLQTH